MPKLKNQYPKNCRDRNQSFSWYNGKRIYHGVWGSPDADKNYKRFIARLLENPVLPLQNDKTGDVLVSELAAGFLNYVEIQYDKTEFQHFKRAIGFLIRRQQITMKMLTRSFVISNANFLRKIGTLSAKAWK